MIYVFGSNHLDTKELPEIRAAFEKLGPNLHLGIELSNDSETKALLDNITTATETEIRAVVRRHYVGPPSGAYQNLLKFLSTNKSRVSEIFIIEPKDTKEGKILNRKMWDDIRPFETAMRSQGKKDPERLLKINLQSLKSTVRQCEFRENGMIKIIDAHLNKNPGCNLFLYCGMFHQPYITNHLAKIGKRYSTRSSIAAKGAVRYITNARGLALKGYSKLNSKERLSLAHSALEDSVYLYLKNPSMEQYYGMLKKIREKVKSIKDFESASTDCGTFIRGLAESS